MIKRADCIDALRENEARRDEETLPTNETILKLRIMSAR